jgi:hypothetical protein
MKFTYIILLCWFLNHSLLETDSAIISVDLEELTLWFDRECEQSIWSFLENGEIYSYHDWQTAV